MRLSSLIDGVLEQEPLPDEYKEFLFSEYQIEEFKSSPVWQEIEKRLKIRMFLLFEQWIFEESEEQRNLMRGQAKELCYLLKTPDEMKPIIDENGEQE